MNQLHSKMMPLSYWRCLCREAKYFTTLRSQSILALFTWEAISELDRLALKISIIFLFWKV